MAVCSARALVLALRAMSDERVVLVVASTKAYPPGRLASGTDRLAGGFTVTIGVHRLTGCGQLVRIPGTDD